MAFTPADKASASASPEPTAFSEANGVGDKRDEGGAGWACRWRLLYGWEVVRRGWKVVGGRKLKGEEKFLSRRDGLDRDEVVLVLLPCLVAFEIDNILSHPCLGSPWLAR